MRFVSSLLAVMITGCASATPPAKDPGPGPKVPLGPDVGLDEAPGLDIHDRAATDAWIAERIANAKAGVGERVRLPLIRRGDALSCHCPPYGIGLTSDVGADAIAGSGPFYWLAVRDLTSVGIANIAGGAGPSGWTGWVDARFTGETEVYKSADAGGTDVVLPVVEVYRQSRRAPDEAPQVRFAAP